LLSAAEAHSARGLKEAPPGVLDQVHVYWKGRSLDGFGNIRLIRIGERVGELIGVCDVLGDKGDPSTVPIHLRLAHAKSEDAIAWLEGWIGIQSEDPTRMAGFSNTGKQSKWAYQISFDPSSIDWAYTVTFGEKPKA